MRKRTEFLKLWLIKYLIYLLIAASLLGVAVIPLVAGSSERALTPMTITKTTIPTKKTIKELVADEFKDHPIMIEVAKCESGFTQFSTSTEVLRGKSNAHDIGIFQINELYHRKNAESLGINIDTIEGNIAYARVLFSKGGTAPWSASQYCWDK